MLSQSQADCGSIKDTGVPAEEGTGAGECATNLIIANVETLSNDDSNSHSFFSDSHEFRA